MVCQLFYYYVREYSMRKALLVYNPISGQRSISGKLDYAIDMFMKKDILLQPYRIINDVEGRLLSVIKEEKYDFIVASGGDGTINSIANLMLKNNIDVPLGVIPTGTCNDFARSLNIPGDFKKCLEIILRGNTTSVDVGLINGEKYFLDTCAAGLFVDVSYNTNNELKKNLGPLAYYLKALTELKNIKPMKLKVKADGEVIEHKFLIFLVLNGRHAAGFYNLNKKADMSDGYMDIMLIKKCPNVDIVGMLINTLQSNLVNNKNVKILKAQNCEIIGDPDIELSVDGEKWKGLPINIQCVHKALKVFV